MKSKLVYLHSNGEELASPTKREVELIGRRDFIKRSSLFLPLAFFAGSALTRTAKASSVIISRTIAAVNQNAISMANATWARPITIPFNWSKIRVGMRMHMTNGGVPLASNPIFAMGFCSGTTNQYGSSTTTHFVGMAWDSAIWTYNAGPPPHYLMVPPVGRKRVAIVNTDTAVLQTGANTDFGADAAGTGTDRFIYFFDLTKGSPNYTLQVPFFIDNSVVLPAETSSSGFLAFMGFASPAPVGYQPAGTARTLPVDEAGDGTLNAVNLYWNRVDATCEVCDIAVAVLA